MKELGLKEENDQNLFWHAFFSPQIPLHVLMEVSVPTGSSATAVGLMRRERGARQVSKEKSDCVSGAALVFPQLQWLLSA